MHVHLFELFASRCEVLAGVKVARVLGKVAAAGDCDGQAPGRVDVHFANSALGGLAELVFGDSDSTRHLSAVLLDDRYVFTGT